MQLTAPAPDRPAGKGGNRVLFGLLGLGCFFALGCGVIGVLALVGAGSVLEQSSTPPPPEHRAACFTIDDLVPWFEGLEAEPEFESFSSSRLFGAREVECEYETPDGHSWPLYLYSVVSEAASASDARTDYAAMKISMGVGVRIGSDVELRQADHLLDWGDQSEVQLLMTDEGPGGMFVIAREGRRTLLVSMGGVYFDDPEIVREAFVPWLERASALVF